MAARRSNAGLQAPRAVPGAIRRWPYDDKWGGAGITEGSARAQARYAAQMYDAAMRGRLADFERYKEPTT